MTELLYNDPDVETSTAKTCHQNGLRQFEYEQEMDDYASEEYDYNCGYNSGYNSGCESAYSDDLGWLVEAGARQQTII